MLTFQDLLKRLKDDQEFTKKFNEAVTARREAGAESYYETIIPVAAELGYDVKPEELDSINDQVKNELSEEELGKVAGGTSCLTMIASLTAATTVCVTVASVIDTIVISIEEITGQG